MKVECTVIPKPVTGCNLRLELSGQDVKDLYNILNCGYITSIIDLDCDKIRNALSANTGVIYTNSGFDVFNKNFT